MCSALVTATVAAASRLTSRSDGSSSEVITRLPTAKVTKQRRTCSKYTCRILQALRLPSSQPLPEWGWESGTHPVRRDDSGRFFGDGLKFVIWGGWAQSPISLRTPATQFIYQQSIDHAWRSDVQILVSAIPLCNQLFGLT